MLKNTLFILFFMYSSFSIAKEETMSNQMTLQAYELSVEEYVEGTPQDVTDNIKTWIHKALIHLSSDAKIFEIGSASGRDANYIESLGFEVERSDATKAFVDLLQREGHQAIIFNVLEDNFPSSYDLIFENAVFLHFTREELKNVLNKVSSSLHTKGSLAFSVKKGVGEGWSTAKIGKPRFFCYWTQEALQVFLKEAGFTVVFLSEDELFLQVIAKKS